MELQTAKNTKYSSEDATGVLEASFGGGTSIFINGMGFDENPQSNFIWMYSLEWNVLIPAPLLTEDDAFGSHPQLGKLVYRLPSLEDLFELPKEAFQYTDTMNFYLSVHPAISPTGHVECKISSNCLVRYKRSYTPILYYLSPRVLFEGATAEIWFDPKSVMATIGDIDSDEKPFVNFKLDESLFEFDSEVVNADTYIYSWSENKVPGTVGALTNGNHDMRMSWENGYARILEETALHCNYDQSDCYYAKTVPVIREMSSHSGYTTGEQSLRVSGQGF